MRIMLEEDVQEVGLDNVHRGILVRNNRRGRVTTLQEGLQNGEKMSLTQITKNT